MFVQLEDNERIVLRYEVPQVEGNDDYAPSGSEFLLIHDIDVTGDYLVLHKAPMETQYRLMWKGDISTCLSRYGDEIESWERDHQMELTVPKK